MQMKGLAIAMGLGAAVGDVAVTLLPRQSTARKLVDKTAGAVEEAAQQVSNKLMEKMDM
jgi:ethanolamine utilization microcompartment shell protein EutS